MADGADKARAGPRFLDARGDAILLGDVVRVNALDANGGAYLNMTQCDCEVVGFGRTRVRIQVPSLIGESTVRPDLLVITKPVDGRPLRSWDDVWAERQKEIQACS